MQIIKTLSAAVVAVGVVASAGNVHAAGGGGLKAPHQEWSFQGIFGTYDQAALQRGFQVYKNVCAACHALSRVAFRNLEDLGYNEDEIKALASEYEVTDGPDEEGEMFDRPAIPADRWPSPFPNKQAAQSANGGAYPVDLSLITKARAGGGDSAIRVSMLQPTGFPIGADYVYALLTSYEDNVSDSVLESVFDLVYQERLSAYENALADYEKKIEAGKEADKPEAPEPVTSIEDIGLPDTANFNAYYPGYGLAMAAPLYEDSVEYADGTPATVSQMAHDVATFLNWAAEPELNQRKNMGLKVILFLIVFTAMLYALKRKIWADLH